MTSSVAQELRNRVVRCRFLPPTGARTKHTNKRKPVAVDGALSSGAIPAPSSIRPTNLKSVGLMSGGLDNCAANGRRGKWDTTRWQGATTPTVGVAFPPRACAYNEAPAASRGCFTRPSMKVSIRSWPEQRYWSRSRSLKEDGALKSHAVRKFRYTV